jgi:hypothetical protein
LITLFSKKCFQLKAPYALLTVKSVFLPMLFSKKHFDKTFSVKNAESIFYGKKFICSLGIIKIALII